MTQILSTIDLQGERRRLALLASNGDAVAERELIKVEAKIALTTLAAEHAQLAAEQRALDQAEAERQAAADALAKLVAERRERMTAAIALADKTEKQLGAFCTSCKALLAAAAEVHGLNQQLGYGNPGIPSISLTVYVEARLGVAGVGQGSLPWQEESQRLADRLNLVEEAD